MIFRATPFGAVFLRMSYVSCRLMTVQWWPLREWAVSLNILGRHIFSYRFRGDGKRYRGVTVAPTCGRCGCPAYIHETVGGVVIHAFLRDCSTMK